MRKHFIDNLRWIVVLLLFPYHTFMIYNTFGESFYIKGPDISITSTFIVATWPWIMPLLFTVAGISSAYALKKRSTLEYLNERVTKLLVPLIFGILLLIPIITYYAERFHNGYTGNYFEQYILFFTKPTDLTGYHGGFTPGHLWFILYLFVISLVALPIMTRYEKTNRKLPISKINLPILLTLFIIPFVSQVVLDISGKSIGEYFAFFLIGYFVLSDEQIQQMLDKYRYLLTLIFLVGMVFILICFNNKFNVNGLLFDLIEEFYAFCGILALLGMSRRYLNFINSVTDFFSKTSFTVYLFHQIWIAIVAFYIFKLTQQTALQIILILVGSVPFTFFTYYICRKFSVTRFMFGIKK
ncbi:acyltransferase family protein [Paenibacillus sp. N1-5-1-14]|uniref:acyltransferase family protein n=1 Tax=Paenibacillus radicibacter TaxID=2972488 RepID=UPI002158C76A|nr:acyltransferase family protein [Paenibacillus radicibacter]MCR8645515.1 acyltransferase family protein [Paenibacillus radicibacter]